MKRNGKRGRRIKVKRAEGTLSVTRANVAGIDLGSQEHWVSCPPRGGEANVKTFGTTTPELAALADGLQVEGVASVAMESTGVYWIPLYELLEQRNIEVVLADARQMKHVPGRKTDMIDCQWLQLLPSCGLLRGAFRPADAFCRLRALVRQKSALIDEQATWLNRMQKSLDQMNVRVHRAVSDISGITGMAMLRAIVAGERDPRKLADLRDERCHKSIPQIIEELTGNWREDHLFNLKEALAMYDFILARIAAYEAEIQRILKELAPHPAWGPAPDPSNPNKKKLQRTRVGAALRMAAVSLRNSKTALGGAYRRLARRKGASVAVFATARKLAILIYRMLRYGAAYVDEGLQHYERRFQEAKLRMCQEIANQFGYKVIRQETA